MARILIVEDERVPREGVSAVLRESGHVVTAASNGQDGLRSFRQHRPDLVLLDIMMPRMDGYAVCAEIRREDRETPVIFLSALDSEADQIRGLSAGADDFVPKAASNELLLARIRTALERSSRFSQIAAPLEMTKTEADIFRLLESARGRFFTYQEIFSAICGAGYVADEGTIRVHISHMRKKLPHELELRTKRGFGYSLAQRG